MKKRKLPKGCRTDPETGEILCEDGADKNLEPVAQSPNETLGNIFKNTGTEVESIHCDTDRKDGKFKCKMKTSSDRKPSDSSS